MNKRRPRQHKRRAHPRRNRNGGRTRVGKTTVNKGVGNRKFLFGDFDKDGVPNWNDCKPFDKTRQGSDSVFEREVKRWTNQGYPYFQAVTLAERTLGRKRF